MANDTNKNLHEERLKRALAASDLPQLYFNGFVNNTSTGDVTTVLERNGKPIAVLNMSFTVAKTFGISLGRVVANLEEKTGRPMLTTHEVDKFFKAASNSPAKSGASDK